MQLTSEQRRAVQEPGHVCLVSCPGSGKTRVVIAKLLNCIENVRDTTRRVACITHTNAAADEIHARLCEMCFGSEDMFYEVATIHGFALQNVLRPFGHLLAQFRNGFTILTADDEAYAAKAQELMTRFNVKPFAFDDFERIQRGPGGTIRAMDTLPEALQLEWCEWLDSNAFTTLGEIVYHSERLVTSFPHVASALASRFAWVLVDEFQDSSPSQIGILLGIHKLGRTQFFCVGDPNQSIFGFAGASASLLSDFAARIDANTNHCLTGNFRSSAAICERAELLRPCTPPMEAVGKNAKCEIVPRHVTVAKPGDGIFEYFLPALAELNIALGEAAVLAPWWIPLFHLARELRSRGIPAIGPGARPYRRSHLVSQIVEPVGAYLESPDAEIAISVQRALYILIASMTDRSPHLVFDFRGRVAVCRMLAEARTARASSARAVEWITDATERFARILVSADFLPKSADTILQASASQMCADILDREGGDKLTVGELGIFARPRSCLQLLTVHKAKGREFDAVAVVTANAGSFPHFSTSGIKDPIERQARYDESRRVFYVATTRAKRVLMFFSDKTDPRNRPTPFLAEMDL